MLTGTLIISLRIYSSDSLKDKRRVLKSIIDRIKHKFNVSIAETGRNDNRRIAEVGIAVVSNSKDIVDRTFERILDYFDSDSRIEITESTRHFERYNH